jgi:phosphatidylglycerol:prolipoprotein diacylglycerol transferase
MLQELFRIPGLNLPILSFGLMLVIGFLAALQLAKFLARRSGLDPEVFVNAGLIALLAGIAGARLSHVLENLDQYTNPARPFLTNLLDAVNIRSGGLTYYGGLLVATPILIWYAMKKRIPVRVGMDIIAPCLMVGLAFGRIGCFLNGCCYGAECHAPWAVAFPYQSPAYVDQFAGEKIAPPAELLVPAERNRSRLVSRDELRAGRTRLGPLAPNAAALARAERSLPLHPAQLYSALTAFLIAGICVSYFTLPHAPGRGFALMMMLEGLTRYVLEMLRAEPAVWGTALTLSQWLGMGLVIGGIILWFAFGRFAPVAKPAPALA